MNKIISAAVLALAATALAAPAMAGDGDPVVPVGIPASSPAIPLTPQQPFDLAAPAQNFQGTQHNNASNGNMLDHR
ncbi:MULTISPECIES: hypothetical protein [Streptomyces]